MALLLYHQPLRVALGTGCKGHQVHARDPCTAEVHRGVQGARLHRQLVSANTLAALEKSTA